jgi:hypothetical protein
MQNKLYAESQLATLLRKPYVELQLFSIVHLRFCQDFFTTPCTMKKKKMFDCFVNACELIKS